MEGLAVSGEEFNRIYKGKLFVKLTNSDENHNGFQFNTGLNVDTLPFNPKGECRAGGIYFCEYGVHNMIEWLCYGEKRMVYYRYVQVPKDSRVYIESGKYKVDKLILSERKLIGEDILMEALRKNRISLADVENKTEAICIAAVKQNGLALKYVVNQTEEMCSIAVDEDGRALKYVKDQTEGICLAAVKQNGLSLNYVKKQTDEIRLAAVHEDFMALEYVKDQTECIRSAALEQKYLLALKCK
jgi:hypothetical protein